MPPPDTTPEMPVETTLQIPGNTSLVTASLPVNAAVTAGLGIPTAEELARLVGTLSEDKNVLWTTWQTGMNTGKFNFLRITSVGKISLDVIKPGVHFHRAIQLDLGMDEISAIRRRIQEQTDWAKSPEGFLLEGIEAGAMAYDSTQFDSEGATRPGAIYVFNRTMVLKHPRGQEKGLRLRWTGRHTNPGEGQKNFQVDDTLQIEEF